MFEETPSARRLGNGSSPSSSATPSRVPPPAVPRDADWILDPTGPVIFRAISRDRPPSPHQPGDRDVAHPHRSHARDRGSQWRAAPDTSGRRPRETSSRPNARYVPGFQNYLHDIADTPLLSARGARAGRADRPGDPYAREHMVKANLRLVVNLARGYLDKGLSLEDLIEEGNLGLMRAVEGYDGTMETRFSTYASYWIKQSIRRSVMNNGKPIRLPAYMVSLLAKWKRATAVLTERLGRAPTPEEVGKALRLSKKKVGDRRQGDPGQQPDAPPRAGDDEDGFAIDDVLTDEQDRPRRRPDRGRRPRPDLPPARPARRPRGDA